jgi:hypothetical protein
MFVPHHQWLEECMALSRVNDQLNQAESQQHKDREEISHLQLCIAALEDELFSVKANLFASIAKKVADKPLTGMPACHLFNLDLVHHPVLKVVCSPAHRLIPKHWGTQNQHPIPKMYPWVCLIKGKGALHPILPLETHL